jgi:phosphomannomutase / phosphoglucomutase
MIIGDNMNETIFRAYDIRGIYDTELTTDLAFKIGQAFGSKLVNQNKKETIVGYDTRVSSIPLFKALTKGITSTGINVINIGLVTTPMYYYAWHLLKIESGIMITASHNPKEYNGFKISFNGINNAYGDEIQEFKNQIKEGNFKTGKGKIITKKIKKDYINFLLKDVKLGKKKIKVVVDAGNASATIVIKDILNKFKVKYIPLYFKNDPTFPNHHPDPSVPENLKDLSEAVIKHKADIGFAYDGDADRLGLVDNEGKMINIDHFMIVIIRNIINNFEDKRILYDVKCSKSLEDEIIKLGGTPFLSRTGNSYLRAAIAKEQMKFGGELSGHVFFNDKFPGYDDGIYASLRMMEILSNSDRNIKQLMEGIEHYEATPEIKVRVTEDTKFSIVESVKQYAKEKNYNLIDIDGAKIIFEDGFALVRASNTGPNLTLRFEAKTKDRLYNIQKEIHDLLIKTIKKDQ